MGVLAEAAVVALVILDFRADPEIPNSRRSPHSRFQVGRELESGVPAGNRGGIPRFPMRPKSGIGESPISRFG
jgi:hypothetical protein